MNSFWNNMRILGFCGCAWSNCPILLVPGWLNLSLQSMGSSIHKRVPMTVMAGRGWGKSTMILLWPTASDWEFSMSCVFGHKLRFLYSHFTFIMSLLYILSVLTWYSAGENAGSQTREFPRWHLKLPTPPPAPLPNMDSKERLRDEADHSRIVTPGNLLPWLVLGNQKTSRSLHQPARIFSL